jgi:DNA anti-recombination protein RmuC
MQIEDDGPGIAENQRERLHEDASNLSRALTGNVKAQGNWGEQQLERLLEVAGLHKGVEYSTQYSVTTSDGQRIQPELAEFALRNKVALLSPTNFLATMRTVAVGLVGAQAEQQCP